MVRMCGEHFSLEPDDRTSSKCRMCGEHFLKSRKYVGIAPRCEGCRHPRGSHQDKEWLQEQFQRIMQRLDVITTKFHDSLEDMKKNMGVVSRKCTAANERIEKKLCETKLVVDAYGKSSTQVVTELYLEIGELKSECLEKDKKYNELQEELNLELRKMEGQCLERDNIYNELQEELNLQVAKMAHHDFACKVEVLEEGLGKEEEGQLSTMTPLSDIASLSSVGSVEPCSDLDASSVALAWLAEDEDPVLRQIQIEAHEEVRMRRKREGKLWLRD